MGTESGRETEVLLSVSESGTGRGTVSASVSGSESESEEAALGQQGAQEEEQEKTWDDFRCST